MQGMAPKDSMLLDLGFLRERGKAFVSPDHKRRTAVAVRRLQVLAESHILLMHILYFPFWTHD